MPNDSTLYGRLLKLNWRTPIDIIHMDELDLYILIHEVEMNMYICFGIIALLLIALIVIVLLKKK